MAEISHDDLKEEIHAILKTADLNVVSAKKIREAVEKKLECSLLSRKKECDEIVMDYISATRSPAEDEDETSDEDEEEEEKPEEKVEVKAEKKTEAKAEAKAPKKRKAASTPAKKVTPPPKKKKAGAAKKKNWSKTGSGSESTSDGSDSDYRAPKSKGTGFTRSYKLSPDLASLVGADEMPRHEVVKKIWSIVKERQLADPNNKQFTICDDELYKVMKIKRFRTFAMLKHLKPHFID